MSIRSSRWVDSAHFKLMKHSNTPAKLLLSLGTAPLLVALVGSKVLATLMQEIGQTTEELFRGDRLPVLKIAPKDEEG